MCHSLSLLNNVYLLNNETNVGVSVAKVLELVIETQRSRIQFPQPHKCWLVGICIVLGLDLDVCVNFVISGFLSTRENRSL